MWSNNEQILFKEAYGMRRPQLLALVLCAAMALTACGSGSTSGTTSSTSAPSATDSQSSTQTEPTQPSGTALVYTPHQGRLLEEWGPAFAEAYPGLSVETQRIGTTQLIGRLRAEKANPQADVWVGGGGIVPFITLAKEGLLEPYQPKGSEVLDTLPDSIIWHADDWSWVAPNLIAMGIVYNPNRISKEELPKTWDDLADPKWKGRIEMWDPASSGTSAAFVVMNLARLGEEKGWEYLKAVYQNVARYTAEGSPAASVARGEIDLGITYEHTALIFRDEAQRTGGNPDNVAFYLPEKTLVMAEPMALVKGGPNPEVGKAFMDFLMTVEGQRVLSEYGFMYPVIPGAPTPPGAFYTVEDYYQRAIELDPEWMAANLDRALKIWKNEVETAK